MHVLVKTNQRNLCRLRIYDATASVDTPIDSTKAQFPRKVRPAERMVTTGGIHLLFQQRKNTLYKIETLKQKKSELF